MHTKQELEIIIMDYIKALKEQIPHPEQIQLLHEMLEAFEAFKKV